MTCHYCDSHTYDGPAVDATVHVTYNCPGLTRQQQQAMHAAVLIDYAWVPPVADDATGATYPLDEHCDLETAGEDSD